MLEADVINKVALIGTGVIFAFAVAALVFVAPLRIRVALLAVFALPQFIIPGLAESASVFQIWVVLCGLLLLLKEKPHAPFAYGYVLLAVAGAASIATLWSPEKNLALISIVQILSLLVVAMHVAYLARQDPDCLRLMFRWLSVGVLTESVMVAVFRLSPAVEATFLGSPVARLLIGNGKMDNFVFGDRDNVYDPVKAGGLWLNANTASLFLGVAACVFVVAGIRFRSKWFYLVALLAGLSVAFTGSKTGVVLLLVLPIAAIVVPLLMRPKGRFWILPLAFFAWPAALLVGSVADGLVPESVLIDSATTLSTRSVIWQTAASLFERNPFLGLGYGGWAQEFMQASGAALGRYFPPHNIFISAWSDGGVVFAILVAAFFAAVLIGHLKMMARTPTRESYAWGFGLAGFLWILIHGQADAVTFYGDLRTLILPGILLGFLMARPPLPEVEPGLRAILEPGVLHDKALGRVIPVVSEVDSGLRSSAVTSRHCSVEDQAPFGRP